MARLDALLQYFPTGTTEGERQFLDRAFVAPGQLAEVLACVEGSPRILVANKGVGKTAVLEWIHGAAERKSVPALFLRPDDLEVAGAGVTTDVGTLKREM